MVNRTLATAAILGLATLGGAGLAYATGGPRMLMRRSGDTIWVEFTNFPESYRGGAVSISTQGVELIRLNVSRESFVSGRAQVYWGLSREFERLGIIPPAELDIVLDGDPVKLKSTFMWD